MRASGRLHRLPFLTVLIALCLALGGQQLPANAVPPPQPNASWTGFAFDTCAAPSNRVMDRWLRTSPFLGVGVYIGGSMRACAQPNLTPRWVKRQRANGWQLLPIWVGPQASCAAYRHRISPRPGARELYPVARSQGIRAARGAKAAARGLGIPKGSTLWYDLEAFSARNGDCRRSSLRFLSAWTGELHRAGYRSGVYSSVSAAIVALHGASPRRYTLPDDIWFAWANRQPDSDLGEWVRSPRWSRSKRVHQFRLNDVAAYGGRRLSIDRNFVSLGRGSTAPDRVRPCDVRVDFKRYQNWHRGEQGAQVLAVQCLLRRRDHYAGELGKRYDTATWSAVKSFQRAKGLPRTGRVNRRTWTVLLATGARAVVKRGSTGPAVRRVQRALTAAVPGVVGVNGVSGPKTVALVRRYQRRLGMRPTGVVAGRTWDALLAGRSFSVRGDDAGKPDRAAPKRTAGKAKAKAGVRGKGKASGKAKVRGKGKARATKRSVRPGGAKRSGRNAHQRR